MTMHFFLPRRLPDFSDLVRTTTKYKAEPGKAIIVEQLLVQVIDKLEEEYPQIEFRMVEVGKGNFNFIAQSLKKEHANAVSEAGV